jgi:GTP cyclohydrolase IA
MHQCMCSRGVRKREGKMVTSCLLGAFKENPASRAEFLALVNG